jgi:ribosome-associated toxin RatA of RatAB toxin-antitoxin module
MFHVMSSMISARRRSSVACRIDGAFEYVADWGNLKSFMPLFMNMEPVSYVHYGAGASFDTTVVLGKIEIRTTLDVTEFVKNSKITLKATRGIRLRASWEFKDIGNNVLITFDFDYDLPSGLTFREDQKQALEKDLEESAMRSMELLKWVLETSCKGQDYY